PVHAVIEVDEPQLLTAPQEVADMAIAVQTEAALCAEIRQQLAHALQQLVAQAFVGRYQFRGNEVVPQQELAARLTELLEVQRGAVTEAAAGSNCVQAAEAATQQAQQLTTRLRGMSATPRVHREQEVAIRVQAA